MSSLHPLSKPFDPHTLSVPVRLAISKKFRWLADGVTPHRSPSLAPVSRVAESVVVISVVPVRAANGEGVGVDVAWSLDVAKADAVATSGIEAACVEADGIVRIKSVLKPVELPVLLLAPLLVANDGRLFEFATATATETPRKNPISTCLFVQPDGLEWSGFLRTASTLTLTLTIVFLLQQRERAKYSPIFRFAKLKNNMSKWYDFDTFDAGF